MKELIKKILIPNYPDKILTAKARRPIYYVNEHSTVRGRVKIPPSFLNTEKYYFNTKGILISKKTGLPQLANPGTAGKPRYWVVNFQDIWNGNMAKQDRAIKVDKLKNILKPYIETIDNIVDFPIELNLIIHNLDCPVDISNKGVIYTKVIEDLLVELGKIPDDSIEYINCSGSTKFIKSEESLLEIRIYKSEE